MKPAFLRVLSSALLLALLFAAALPVSAFADEGTPPPTEEPTPPPDDGSDPAAEESAPTEEVASDPVEESAPSEEVASDPVEESAPSEEVASDPVEESAPSDEVSSDSGDETAPSDEVVSEPVDEPAPSEVVSSDSVDETTLSEEVSSELIEEPAPSEDLAEVLADLPDGTELVVLNEEGEQLPLASQEAAELIEIVDPMWCPAGITPFGAGCSIPFDSLELLVSGFTPPAANGVIWIEAGADSSVNPITINGTTWSAAANFSLTLKGGWSGAANTITSSLTPSEFDQSILIVNWVGDVTLSDILITGVTGGGNTALTVETSGKIVLTRVDVVDNEGPGAYLDNDGAEGKDVTVSLGEFDNNQGGTGLEVWSKGVITLSSVTANDNGLVEVGDFFGAYLNNSDAGIAKNVVITSGGFEFNNNDDAGLVVFSKGLIALKDIDAIGNGGSGAYLNNTAGVAGVTLTGANVFGENGNMGLRVYSKGAINLNNVIANANNGGGADLDNCNWDSEPDACLAAQPITLTGTNEFKFNSFGLYAYSGGAITLNNVTASNNFDWEGAWLNNYDSPLATKPGVTLTGTNSFTENGGNGIAVVSKGAIKINNLTANGNGYANGGSGAWLDNCGVEEVEPDVWVCTTVNPQPVMITVSGGNTDTEFKDNESYGVYIQSKGAISLVGVVATGNGYGGFMDNNWDGAVGGITVTGWGASFSDNFGNGLHAYSRGTISFTHLYAWGNDGDGALLSNLGGIAPVMFTGESSFGNNEGGTGLEIFSRGAVTLNNLYAENNNGFGVFINNSYGTQNVTLSGASHDFSNNYGGSGLEIYSYGQISIANLTASDNRDGGAVLDNYLDGAGLAKPVLLTGDNTFERNEWTGLDISSKGTITINNVIASDNYGFGAYLDNQWTGAVGAVNVNNTASYWPEFSNNGLDGLRIYSNGAVTVKDLDANNNGWWENEDFGYGNTGYGVLINNTTATGNVMVGTGRAQWWNWLHNNFRTGLWIDTRGMVTLSNLSAAGNGLDLAEDPLDEYLPSGYGAYVDNSSGAIKSVTLNGTNWFTDNASGGLYIYSAGPVTLNNVEADDNGIRSEVGDGLHVDTCLYGEYEPGVWSCWIETAPQAVNVKGNNEFYGNWNNGLQIQSKGAISVNNVTASYNGDGAELYNWFTGPATPQNVTLTGFGEFFGNYNNGLEVYSYGMIFASNLDASDNGWGSGGFGVYLDNCLMDAFFNCDATLPKAVTVSGVNSFSGNENDGLDVESFGAITVSNLWSENNGGDGVELDNAWDGAVGGVTVNGTSGFDDNGGDGLKAYSYGAIKANNLSAWGNGGDGAHLDNDWLGSTIGATVILTGSNDFGNNGGDGLYIESWRTITISNIYSSWNGGFGAWIDNTDSGTAVPENVTITGTNGFYSNQYDGLWVTSYGVIAASNVTANDNGQYNFWAEAQDPPVDLVTEGRGVYLNNCGFDWDLWEQDCTLAELPKAITLTGVSTFNGNWDGGLEIHSLGVITLSNVGARENWFGVLLDNNENGAVGGVTITGRLVTRDNATYGLDLTSKGAISINVSDAWAAYNGEYGWHLSNTESTLSVKPGVTLASANTDWAFDFDSNGEYGLLIESLGNISVAGLDAYDNGWNGGGWGAMLDNAFEGATGTITIAAPTWSNAFNGNWGDGLLVYSNGAISVGKLEANDNGWDCSGDPCVPVEGLGVLLDNTTSVALTPPSITITGFGNFRDNADTGLTVLSYGIITLNNITANDNGQYNYWAVQQDPLEPTNGFGWGVYLDNCGYYWNDDISWWDCSNTTVGKGITLNGTNTFNGNFQDGLWATSLGAIKGSNFTANGNLGRGAYLDNGWEDAGAKGGVTLTTTTSTGWNQFNNNGGLGLEAWSFNGAITLSNVMANDNAGGWAYNATWGGAFLEAWGSGSTFAQKVTLLGRNQFNNNYGGKGLGIYATGDITVNNLTANNNFDGGGAALNNCLAAPGDPCWGTGNINMTGVNTFNGNNGDGLWIDSKGIVTISKLTADNNAGRGVYVRRSASLTISCGSLTNNGLWGWQLNSTGTITLKNVWALGNNGGGGNTWLESGTLSFSRSC